MVMYFVRNKNMKRNMLNIFLFLASIAFIFVVLLLFSRRHGVKKSRTEQLSYISNIIESQTDLIPPDGMACRFPQMNVDSPEILSLLKDSKHFDCEDNRDWVEVSGSVITISPWVSEKYKKVRCSFTEIIRESDDEQYVGAVTKRLKKYKLKESDVVSVQCGSSDGQQWSKIVTGIREDSKILTRMKESKPSEDGLGLDVVILCIDSLSHNMWKRKLPKTYKYAIDKLEGVAFNGYNIVAEGSFHTLIPMLTGKSELELPNTRRNQENVEEYLDIYPFIWKTFSKYGYATALGNNLPDFNPFNERHMGFNKQPVDHYLRTFFIEAEKDIPLGHCYGNESRLNILLNFIGNMYQVYSDQPKFIFAYHAQRSIYDDLPQEADDEILQWIKDFQSRLNNNTLLILTSNHGTRLPAIIKTVQGKQEERLPALILVFPTWFKEKYPEALSNVRLNAERLTTPFDVYTTIKDIIHFNGEGIGHVDVRGISLFQEIPMGRTCQNAYILPYACTCLDWKELPIDSTKISKAFKYFASFVNRKTKAYRKTCRFLNIINEEKWAALLRPNTELLTFSHVINSEEYLVDKSSDMQPSEELYQLKATFEPGLIQLEAEVTYNLKTKKYKMGEIHRSNKNNRDWCIEYVPDEINYLCSC